METNTFLLDILKFTDQLIVSNIKVNFVWAKGHANIQGNEKVDHIAKNFQDYGATNIEEFNPSDTYHRIKQTIKSKWQERWQLYGEKGNTTYYKIHKNIPMNYWYTSTNANRQMVATIARLKTNHERFPAHLFKIGIAQTPLCTCNDVPGDLNHIFFNCTNN